MGKKTRSRAHQIGSSEHGEPSTRTLQRFKSRWATADWTEALDCYRRWANKVGKQHDPRIESELLFRSASAAYQKGDFERALARLAEASPLDPSKPGRYLRCKGICLAKAGKVKEGIDLFTEARDEYHSRVLSFLVERKKPLPKLEPVDIAFESNQLLSFWQGLSDGNASEPASTVLRKLRKAYLALTRGEDPDPALVGLGEKPGFENLALYLTALAAVRLRKNIRIRHLIAADPSAFREETFLALLDSHLLLLLREKEYREIEVLKSLFDEHHIHPRQLARVMDELLFASALDEVDAGRLESALERLREIGQRTPSLIHNMALLYQKIGEFSEANSLWITLLKLEGKPKRADPEERRLSYAAAAKQIASNYLIDDQLEKAVHYFKEALGVSEDDREALENLVAASFERGEPQHAVFYARRLFDLDPRNPECLLGYLSALLARGSVDILLPLVEENWERHPEDSPVRRALAEIAIQAAWRMRESNPEKARQIVALVREFDADIPHLIHLEGYFLAKDGKREQAETRFARLIERTFNHAQQALFGMTMYLEGYRAHSLSLFNKLICCGCDASAEEFERIIDFLGQRNDHDFARHLCLSAIDSQEYSPYMIADILFTAGKSLWAREFSEMLLEDPDSEEDEYFLHLLILNEIGNPAETIQFAESMRNRFGEGDDPETLSLMDYTIKQLRTKGRLKLPHV